MRKKKRYIMQWFAILFKSIKYVFEKILHLEKKHAAEPELKRVKWIMKSNMHDLQSSIV